MCARRDLPDGLSSELAVQPQIEKYFLSSLTQIKIISTPSRPSEGRFAIVTDVGRDAVDAKAALTNGADADGEVVWF